MLATIPAPVSNSPRPSIARSGRSLAAAGDGAVPLTGAATGTPCWTTVPAAAGSVVTCAQDKTGLLAMLRRRAMKRNGLLRDMMILGRTEGH
jgi:hypothetical protein